MGVLDRWKVTRDELEEIMSASPSLRGFIFGYLAEHKLRKMWFSDARITNLHKSNNHDRRKKGDVTFIYEGTEVTVEVKSLQTNSVRREGTECRAKYQCDASDRRQVVLPNGEKVQTTCVVVGEFDLVAVNLFEFEGEWRFAFAKNSDLPRSRYTKYSPEQRQYILATLMEVTWPLRPPYEPEPFRLLDEIVAEKQGRASRRAPGQEMGRDPCTTDSVPLVPKVPLGNASPKLPLPLSFPRSSLGTRLRSSCFIPRRTVHAHPACMSARPTPSCSRS